eukprot:SAG31_NODE_1856_length_7063_cov_3.328403_4_plen_148_part_00
MRILIFIRLFTLCCKHCAKHCAATSFLELVEGPHRHNQDKVQTKVPVKHLAKLQGYLSSRLLPSDACLIHGFDGVTAPETIDISQVAASDKDNVTRAVLDGLKPGKRDEHFGPIFMDDPFTVRLTYLPMNFSLSPLRLHLRLHLSFL